METNEMIKTLQKEGYIVKKESTQMSGSKISWKIRDAIWEYALKKYETHIYDKVKYDNAVRYQLINYLKARMFLEWGIKAYTQIPDIEKVVQWGKEWIDDYIEKNREPWDKEYEKFKKKESERIRDIEKELRLCFNPMWIKFVKRFSKRLKQRRYENDLFCYAEDE